MEWGKERGRGRGEEGEERGGGRGEGGGGRGEGGGEVMYRGIKLGQAYRAIEASHSPNMYITTHEGGL